jgi:hypothetical protein
VRYRSWPKATPDLLRNHERGTNSRRSVLTRSAVVIFNITTKNLSAWSTYVYTITLKDGSIILFQFGSR